MPLKRELRHWVGEAPGRGAPARPAPPVHSSPVHWELVVGSDLHPDRGPKARVGHRELCPQLAAAELAQGQAPTHARDGQWSGGGLALDVRNGGAAAAVTGSCP